MTALIEVPLTFHDEAREKPQQLTTNDDLHGLYVVKMGRKSSPNKINPGKSIGDQFKDLDPICDRRGLLELARILEDKQGASRYSKRTERLLWIETLNIIKAHPVAVLAVWELSRSARRLKVFGEMVELLQDTNTLLLTGERLYDLNNPDDQLALSINAAVDENMVARSRKATMRGLRSAAEEGRPHGPNPYGLLRKYNQRTGALISVELHPEQAPIVREMGERVLNNESAHAITRDFTARKLWRSDYGGVDRFIWYPGDVRDMLENPAYKGTRVHTIRPPRAVEETESSQRRQTQIFTHEAIWPGIFTEEEWDRIQLALDGRSKGSPVPEDDKKAKYMLTGIVKCAKCGDGRMHGNRQGGVRSTKVRSEMPMVYHCPSCRGSRQMRYVDQVVRDTVDAWLNDSKFIRQMASAKNREDPELMSNRGALERAEQELEEAYQLADQGKLSVRGLSGYEARLLPEIDRLRRLVVQAEQSALLPNGWKELALGRVAPVLPNDVHDARGFLKRLIRVRILPAGRGVRFHPDQVQIIPLTQFEEE